MKGKEILEFLKTQVIIDTPIEKVESKTIKNLELMAKYNERLNRAYNVI